MGDFIMAIHALKKKFLRIQARKASKDRTETRDAVLWDIVPEQRLCRVKVLGSNVLLECKYPENWLQTPAWLKPRSAVRITHRGGNRNSFEVVGDGLFIPTPTVDPITGITNPSLPNIIPGVDTAMTGCQIYALETPGMQVWVSTGTFRIGGTIYTTDYMAMDESSVADMTSGVPMDQTVGVYNIAAAHATLWRIDRLVIGADLVVDVLTGNNSETLPIAPDTTADHVSLGTVLVPPGVTEIFQTLINKVWDEPYLVRITATVTDSTMAWGTETNEINIAVFDQYNIPYIDESVLVECSITSGSGTLSVYSVNTNPVDGTAVIYYIREDGYAESSSNIESGPVFLRFVTSQDSNVLIVATIILNNEAGEPIL